MQSICFLFKYINSHSELNRNKLQCALGKRRKFKNIPDSAYKISEIPFPDPVSDIDEQTLRYCDIPNLLKRFDYYNVYDTFYYMNKSIWDIIRFTLRSFINPSSKNVINYYQKFGI